VPDPGPKPGPRPGAQEYDYLSVSLSLSIYISLSLSLYIYMFMYKIYLYNYIISILAILYWVFPIGYSLLAIPYAYWNLLHQGMTPLHLAALYGYSRASSMIVQALLQSSQ